MSAGEPPGSVAGGGSIVAGPVEPEVQPRAPASPSRLPTYLTAGALRMPVARFAAWFGLAALLWTPLLVGATWLVGDRALSWLEAYQARSLPILLALAALLWVLPRLLLPLTTFRGRRLLLGRWRRLTRWEFWPMAVFYPPIVLYVLWLGLRHRGLTVFTAANPAMPAGGVVGESKSAILRGLAGAGDRIARYRVIEPGDPEARRRLVADFLAEECPAFPVVLKPDVGERGTGVVIARSDDDITACLAASDERLIVQAYVPGREFGVFYYRFPGEASGRIFAITDKRPPVVTGDGRRTLETLILADDRAVCMGEAFLARHADRLDEVPAAGAAMPLIELGTHRLGCVFLDGAWLWTEALEAEIDRISRTYEGFYFGRYDIRTDDVDAFREGRAYQVVELNGVTSEATSIYDPRNGLLRAYRILARQWSLAFAIGSANRARGVRPVPVAELLRLVRDPGRLTQLGYRADTDQHID